MMLAPTWLDLSCSFDGEPWPSCRLSRNMISGCQPACPGLSLELFKRSALSCIILSLSLWGALRTVGSLFACLQVLDALKTKGISIRVASPKLVMEEAPESYKVGSSLQQPSRELVGLVLGSNST